MTSILSTPSSSRRLATSRLFPRSSASQMSLRTKSGYPCSLVMTRMLFPADLDNYRCWL
nr:MAG TPA: hypothetical protein [Caudoviricetes sp.]